MATTPVFPMGSSVCEPSRLVAWYALNMDTFYQHNREKLSAALIEAEKKKSVCVDYLSLHSSNGHFCSQVAGAPMKPHGVGVR